MLLARLKSRCKGGTGTAQRCEFGSCSDLCRTIQSGFLSHGFVDAGGRRGVARKAPLAAKESGEYALQDPRLLHDIMADKWQVSCMTLEWKMEWNMDDPSPK